MSHTVAADSAERAEIDDLQTGVLQNQQHNSETDQDEQINTLMNEPFVKSIEKLFRKTLEQIKNDPEKKAQFFTLCNSLNDMDENSYESPMKQLFELICALEPPEMPLSRLFVDLLPEKFTQRIFPQFEQNFLEKFDAEVKDKTPTIVYDQYIKLALDNYHNIIPTHQFKDQLTGLLQDYPSLIMQLPVFFSEIGEDDNQGMLQAPADEEIKASAPVQAPPATNTVAPKATTRQPEKNNKNTKNSNRRIEEEAQNAATQAVQQPDLTSQNQMAQEKENTTTVDQQVQAAASANMNTEQIKKTGTKAGGMAPQGTLKPLPMPIPASLQKFPKVDVSFFLDRILETLIDRSHSKDFFKLFKLYLDGVLTQYEFFDLVSDMMDPAAVKEIPQHLQTLLAQRDNSRRDSLEIGSIKIDHMLNKSYGTVAGDYVAPFCTGRYKPGEHAQEVLNDRYIIKTSGTEDFKFKVKNIHEDNLFKNEDEMYAIDHQIVQLSRVIHKLQDEESEAKKWAQLRQAQPTLHDYETRCLTAQHFSFLRKFYEEVVPDQQLTDRQIKRVMAKKPVELLQNWIQRLETHLKELQSDKSDKIAEWKHTCSGNFVKSLDHRSFFFKKEQKDLLPGKKQLIELERIAQTPISRKSVNQLKGGSSPDHEFYCTYTSFKINHIQVYGQEDLEAPSLLQDSPINLRDPGILTRNPGALPHMRFLLNDKKMLEMTFMVLICGPRVGCNITAAEKTKIEDCLEVFIGKYFRCEHSFKQLKTASRKIQLLHEEEIALLTKNPVDYYRAKVQDGFKFETWGEAADLETPATTLQLPLPNEESAGDCDSNAGAGAGGGAGKPNSSSVSENSSSASARNRPPTAADLKQLINLQSEAAENDRNGNEGGRDEIMTEMKVQGLLEPAFKDGYSLIFGTHQLYLVFKMIASIYERLVKARQLIKSKVDLDLQKDEIKEVIGIEDEAKLNTFKEQAVVERFKLFINALIGTMSQAPHKKLDPSNYEDIVRMLMGDQAYLLFVFDRIIVQTLKNIPGLKTNDECQRNLQLFQRFCRQQGTLTPQNEHLYLTQFQHQMQTVNKFNGQCIRLLYSPLSGILCLHLFNLSPFAPPSTGGDANNGAQGTQTLASYHTLDPTKAKQLKQSMYHPRNRVISAVKDQDQNEDDSNEKLLNAQQRHEQKLNRAADGLDEDEQPLRVPVFLNRNRRKMKQLRKHLWMPRGGEDESEAEGVLTVENGLIMRQVPAIRKLMFDANSSDFLAYKRRRFNPLTEEQRAAQDYASALGFQRVLAAQRERQLLQLTSEQVSEEHMASEVDEQHRMGGSGPRSLDCAQLASSLCDRDQVMKEEVKGEEVAKDRDEAGAPPLKLENEDAEMAQQLKDEEEEELQMKKSAAENDSGKKQAEAE